MMKNIKNLSGRALSRKELRNVLGGSGGDGYQCCNQWGCGKCVTGSSEDCSVYQGTFGQVYGQRCDVGGGQPLQ